MVWTGGRSNDVTDINEYIGTLKPKGRKAKKVIKSGFFTQ